MKRSVTLITAIALMLSLTACGGVPKQAETPVPTEASVFSEMSVSARVPASAETNTSDSPAEAPDLPRVHMSTLFLDDLELDIDGKVMALEDVEVHGYPSEDAPVNRTVSYQLVDVYVIVYSSVYPEDELGRWALVSFICFDSLADNVGWVKLTELEQYTADNMELLRYPVTVTEGCKDIDTGEDVVWDAFSVDYEDDCAVVSREGGKVYRVDKEYIIYPEP